MIVHEKIWKNLCVVQGPTREVDFGRSISTGRARRDGQGLRTHATQSRVRVRVRTEG